jgi:RNA polymerase sigma-70 factor, ECF subfamily
VGRDFFPERVMPNFNIDQLTNEYFARIHRAALVLSGNPWDADDLAQETFLTLTRQAQQFRGESSWYTWLYGILLNLERVHRRRAGTCREKLHVLWNAELSSERADPPASVPVETEEWKKSLWSKVAQLADGQRQCLVLRFSEGLSYEEIAVAMNTPLGTVKSRLFHGLAALRRVLQTSEDATLRFPTSHSEGLSHVI